MKHIPARTYWLCAMVCICFFGAECLTHGQGSGQSASPGNASPALTGSAAPVQTNQIPQDARPASSNVPGFQFPMIDSNHRAYFRVVAPEAKSVSVSLPGGRGTKGDDGVWNIVTSPLAPGFHYYTLNVDGATVCDPASESYFGTSKTSSGIEIPSPQEDFYLPKDVPHGDIRAHYYFAKTTGKTRRCYVYTPPTTIRISPPVIRFFTCSTAWAKTLAAGPIRAALASSSII